MNDRRRRRHPLVFLAFILALLVFVLPTHADYVFAAVATRRPMSMAIVTVVCFAVVLLPLITCSVLTSRNPVRWEKSKLATATWVILGLGLIFNGLGWYMLVGNT